MEQEPLAVPSPPIPAGSAEGTMVQEDVVREILARLERGVRVKRIARELGVDKKTVKRWRHLGGWRAQRRRRRQQLEPFASSSRGAGRRSAGMPPSCTGSS